MALDPELQGPFEAVFGDLVARAIEVAPWRARGPGEVGWLEAFHHEAGQHLEGRLRGEMRDLEIADSVSTQTVFVHGNPFQIEPAGPLTRMVEAGDLLVLGQRFGESALIERQALLLQMKVGEPKLGEVSTAEQACLYSCWPEVTWHSQALRGLPGPHPRTPRPQPSRAAQFGVIPDATEAGNGAAWEMDGPISFSPHPRSLAAEMAAVTRLDIGVDATPGPLDGWERIVEDIAVRAFGLEYAQRLPRHSAEIQGNPEAEGLGFVVVAVSTAAPGILD